MNYKKKIQEIQTKINIINKYYINQVTNPSKETINRLEELNQKLDHSNDIQELKEKVNNIRNNIWKSLNMTKDQLELLNIEDT